MGEQTSGALQRLLRQCAIWVILGAAIGFVSFRFGQAVLQYKIYALASLPSLHVIGISLALCGGILACIAWLARKRLLDLNLAHVLQQTI